jgi:formylglycine-generating enzyme
VTTGSSWSFVAATSKVTDAERFGWSFVFEGLISLADRHRFPSPAGTPLGRAVEGASWRSPEGPISGIRDRAHHPVLHVSWNDTAAHCQWVGGRLRRKRSGRRPLMECWAGSASPGAMTCSKQAGIDATCGRESSKPATRLATVTSVLLRSPLSSLTATACSTWSTTSGSGAPTHCQPGEVARVIRGGSFLCHEADCNWYRAAARSRNHPDGGSGNNGLRVVFGAVSVGLV